MSLHKWYTSNPLRMELTIHWLTYNMNAKKQTLHAFSQNFRPSLTFISFWQAILTNMILFATTILQRLLTTLTAAQHKPLTSKRLSKPPHASSRNTRSISCSALPLLANNYRLALTHQTKAKNSSQTSP